MTGQTLRPGAACMIVCAVLAWSGCSGTGRVDVLRPSDTTGWYSSALVTEEGSLETVPGEVRRDFRSALTRYLYDQGPFRRGPDLRVVYAITGYHHAVVGGDDRRGKEVPPRGSVTVDVRFLNFVEKEIGSIRATWDTGENDTLDEAVEGCARQVASYARRTFRDVRR